MSTIIGATTLGRNCKVYPNAVLGAPPQNTKHKGGRTTLAIGNNCTIREGVTMHTGTDTSRGETSVGDNGNFLAYSHIAHDCVVGRNVTMANQAALGGPLRDRRFRQHGRPVRRSPVLPDRPHAFIGGLSAVVGDVIPYGMASGPQATLRGLNVIGMRRSGMPREEILAMRQRLSPDLRPGTAGRRQPRTRRRRLAGPRARPGDHRLHQKPRPAAPRRAGAARHRQ